MGRGQVGTCSAESTFPFKILCVMLNLSRCVHVCLYFSVRLFGVSPEGSKMKIYAKISGRKSKTKKFQ